nr:probable lipid-A-disaccharide synthase, mitochondrial isoform X1 [Ipomoea batatas]
MMIPTTVRNTKASGLMPLLVKRAVSFSASTQSTVESASRDGELRLFIVAGEVSGDAIAARLMNSLKKLSPFPVRFAGVGGHRMSKQGLNSLFPMEDIAVMGIWELLPHLNQFRVKLKQAVQAALGFQPHAVVTVDSKGFSFRFLKHLRARYRKQGTLGPLHFHYVAPSFWAWKGGEARLGGLSEFVDHVLCILPFEAEVCRSNGVAASFVGHPTLEDILEFEGKDATQGGWRVRGDAEKFRNEYGISSGSKVMSLLPGSRLQEVTRMMPIFSNTVKQLQDSFPDLITTIHVAPNQHVERFVGEATCNWPASVILIPGGSHHMKYDSFSASSVALCTSGTVAMELQLARLPCVVAYRAHLLTEWIIRYKAKVSYISLPNILLESAIIPEALFRACTPSKLASLLRNLILDESLRQKQIIAAEKVIRLLRPERISGSSTQLDSMSFDLHICVGYFLTLSGILTSHMHNI